MKQYFLTLATSVTLLCGTLPLQAGTLGPALQQVAESSAAQVDLPVIIRFVDQLDPKAVRAEVGRIARGLYPDNARKRKKERRKLMRKMLVGNLKAVAKDSKKQVKDFLKAHGEKSKLKLLWTQNSVVAVVPVHLLDELAAQDYVDHIVLDATIQAPGTGTPPTATADWNLDATGVPTLWNTGNTGQDVVVATLDTGVDATHPDLGPRWRGGNNSWFDPYGQHSSPADTNGHGTQVMGLIVGGDAGGFQVGMAPGSQWIAAKIFDDTDAATLSGIHAAFQWVLDPDGNSNTDDAPDIVNNSWDLAGTVNTCVLEFAPDIALLKAADIAVVFAGGNYGSSANTSVSPANNPAALSVGAVDSTLGVDTQSSRGANACDSGVYPHLVAPGGSVLTTDRMPLIYNVVSGTSFAVPHLAGGMAVLKSAFPAVSVTELEASLTDTATDLGAGGPDNDYGYGLMDLVAAYDQLASILAPPQVTGIWTSGNVVAGETLSLFIFGDYFDLAPGATQVYVNGIQQFITQVVTAEMLIVRITVTPDMIGGLVTVATTNGSTDSATSFGGAIAGLQITGVWPGAVTEGVSASVFIFGSEFDLTPGATEVYFNGVRQWIAQVVTPEMIIVRTTPTTALAGPVSVTTPAGTAVSSTDLVVVP